MQPAPVPSNEPERIVALERLKVLDTEPEERFDRITREAATTLNAPIAIISMIDEEREWFKSCVGLDIRHGPRSSSFCGHALLSKYVFVVEDTTKDPRFADNPQVIGEPFLRFYAGVALRERKTELPVGVLCVKDYKPRKFSVEEMGTLIALAGRAEDELNRDVEGDEEYAE